MCTIVRQRSFKDILHLQSQLTKFGGILAGFDFSIVFLPTMLQK